MNIIQTHYQKELTKYPADLDVLRELYKRKGLDKNELEALYKLELGHKAQDDLLRAINRCGRDHWIVLRNIDFALNASAFRCDLILITDSELHTFTLDTFEMDRESMADSGSAIFEPNVSHHIYNVITLNNYLSEEFARHAPDVNIQSHLVYMHPAMKVEAENYTPSCKIISQTHLAETIQEIAHDEKEAVYTINRNKVIGIIERLETTNQIGPTPVSDATKQRIQPGICCESCHNLDVYIGQYNISCECGAHEVLERAILRTICEYGVIHFDEPLEAFEVIDFFADQVSPLSILNVLDKYFKRL